MASTKLIVTHRGALTAKYGEAGWRRVQRAIRGLVKADGARGLTTRLVALDGPAVRKAGATPVKDADDVAAVKAAIDALWHAAPPDYLMLLGAPDVVPQASLGNPLYSGDPADDPDKRVPSDLPYACDAPLGESPAAFRGPTRVVGRLPDLVGSRDPAYLVRLLGRAARWVSLVAPRPIPVFALSTLTWRRSTETSIAALGGALGAVHTSPDRGPHWDDADLQAPLHFVNCHGHALDPVWYGERFPGQATLPHALDARRLAGQRLRGTVVATEACYGAMHWDPTHASGQPGMAQTYLQQGAVGVFGASTLSYGPAVGNASADLLARMFLEAVADGASLGRAALVARQRYVGQAGTLDPTDQKTLAQFDLLGDPSVHPIAVVGAGEAPVVPVAFGLEPEEVPHGALRPGVRERRTMLQSMGRALESSVQATRDEPLLGPALSAERFLRLTGADPATTWVRTFEPEDLGRDEAEYHVAFVAQEAGPRALVVVRTEAGSEPVVRRLERK